MNLGERLLNLRKKEHLSQEEVAFKLNVSRQTISKWETDQSTPDFDKIAPLCELYNITADELLTGKKEEIKEEKLSSNKEENTKKHLKDNYDILLEYNTLEEIENAYFIIVFCKFNFFNRMKFTNCH